MKKKTMQKGERNRGCKESIKKGRKGGKYEKENIKEGRTKKTIKRKKERNRGIHRSLVFFGQLKEKKTYFPSEVPKGKKKIGKKGTLALGEKKRKKGKKEEKI